LAADAHAAVNGTVVDVEHDLARVLIGPMDEEWFFPMQTLPDGTGVGTAITFTEVNGRYTAMGLARSATTSIDRSIQDRLSRPLSQRRTADLQAADIAAAREAP
jgi:hypothetical protein